MTSLRHRLIALVSALVMVVALIALPGCKKTADDAKKPTPKKAPDVGIE